MSTNSELIARQLLGALGAQQVWGAVMYNVSLYGLVGDGVTDNTVALQALIDEAISAGRKMIFFPHGAYYVTSLTNDDQVVFVGDNAWFVGGYDGVIQQFGGIDYADIPIDGGNFTDPYLNPIVNGGTF